MKLDLHVHTNHSRDAVNGSPREVLELAKRIGLDGLAITDHNVIEGSIEAASIAKEFGLVVVRGIEVSTASGHVVAYGVDEVIPRGLTINETSDRIRDLGGVAVAAHPKRFPSGMGLRAAASCRFDGIETINGGNPARSNIAARRVAEMRHLSQIGGSDSHRPHELGRAFTVFDAAQTEDDVVDAIRSGLARAEGRSSTVGEGTVYSYETLIEWVRDGLRRQ